MVKKPAKPDPSDIALSAALEGVKGQQEKLKKESRSEIAKRNKTIANLRERNRLLEHKNKEQTKEIAELTRQLRKYTEPPIPEMRDIDRAINFRFTDKKLVLPEN